MALADLDPDALYHLALAADWAHDQAAGHIAPPSLADEGFVHCSWGRQVPGTVDKHFAEVAGLVALRIDVAALGGLTVVEEDSYGSGQTFPHLYGPIPAAAVVSVTPVP